MKHGKRCGNVPLLFVFARGGICVIHVLCSLSLSKGAFEIQSVKICKICSLLKIRVIRAICGSKNFCGSQRHQREGKSCSAKAVESKFGVNYRVNFGVNFFRAPANLWNFCAYALKFICVICSLLKNQRNQRNRRFKKSC